MKKLKRLVAVVAAGVFACSLLALSGCGQDSEELIREGLTEELESLKALDEATLDELMSEADTSAVSVFESYGVDAREFVKAYLDGFDYAIEGVEVDGDQASARLTFTCKSFTDLESVLEDSAMSFATDPSTASLTEDELNAKIGELLMTAVAQTPVRETDPFVVYYANTDDVWELTSDSEDTIVNALFD